MMTAALRQAGLPFIGWVAEWLCSGLQSRVRRFDSALSLHSNARMAKLVDARDLKSLDLNGRAGSTPAPGTIYYFFINNSLEDLFHVKSSFGTIQKFHI